METLQGGNSPLNKLSIDFKTDTRFGGYHNTQKFYSEDILKALKQYQLRNFTPNALKDKETAITGNISFTVGQTIDNLMNNPETLELLYQKSIERARNLGIENKQLKDVIIVQKQQLIEQAPKVEFYDDVTGSTDTIDMSEAAKVLNIKGIGRNNLFEILRNKDILRENNQPYQKYVDAGYFRIIETKYQTKKGDTKISLKTVVFQKGLQFIKRLICG